MLTLEGLKRPTTRVQEGVEKDNLMQSTNLAFMEDMSRRKVLFKESYIKSPAGAVGDRQHNGEGMF